MTEDCKHSDSNTGSTVTTLPKVAHTAEIGSLPGEKRREVIKLRHSGSMMRVTSTPRVLQERRRGGERETARGGESLLPQQGPTKLYPARKSKLIGLQKHSSSILLILFFYLHFFFFCCAPKETLAGGLAPPRSPSMVKNSQSQSFEPTL